MFGVSILVRVLVKFLDIHMVRFGVERELVGFCKIYYGFYVDFKFLRV